MLGHACRPFKGSKTISLNFKHLTIKRLLTLILTYLIKSQMWSKNFINDSNKSIAKRLYEMFDRSKNTRKIINPFVIGMLLIRSGNVERNPGPSNGDVMLISQNCRGLKCKDKLKQLLCRLNKIGSSSKIIALQETHLESSYLKYSWSGNSAITSSLGAKGGIITLVSGNINILDQIDIENDAQILFTEIIDNKESTPLVIVNLHSPCAHDQTKIEFFKKIKDQIDTFRLDHGPSEIVIMGDFNTTFWPSERINTTRSKREVTVASELINIFED